MKMNLLKKTIKFAIFFSYSAFLSAGFAMQEAEIEGKDKQPVRSYFQEDALVIQDALKSVRYAELHFFWTTGRELDALKADYGANFKVDIGGKNYGEIFPLYVGFLLETSPAHLTVKFVCDEMTRNSNNGWISTLQDQYMERFQILDIATVVENLLKALPGQEDSLLTLFQNATKGNPVLGSDPYRLIGLVYGGNPMPENVQDTQYTYCDIDTFCFGMSQPNQEFKKYYDYEEWQFKEGIVEVNGHTNLIKALFCPMRMKKAPVKESFFTEPCLTIDTPVYIGRKDDGNRSNNLIKLRIRDLEKYKGFCYNVLEKIFASKELKATSGEGLNLLNYFSTLHDCVSKGAQDPETAFATYVEKFSSSTMDTKDIMYVTGPGLLDRLPWICFPLEQEYPDINAMEWHCTHHLESHEASSPLTGYAVEDSHLKDAALEPFIQYARKLSDAFYTFRFGENHPFNIKMKDHLIHHFPYASANFKAFMEGIYKDEVKVLAEFGRTELDVENWLDKKVSGLTEILRKTTITGDLDLINAPYYARLHHVLKQLGIDRPLTRDDIDFRIGQ